jgi:molecular chaperone DnaK (HSP70)
MKKDAEEHPGEDTKKKEMVEAKNNAEQMVYTAEKSLKDHEKEIPEDIKKEIEDKIKIVNEEKDKDDKDALAKSVEDLTSSLQKIGEIMQKAAEAEGKENKPKEEAESKGEEEPTVRDAEEDKDNKDAK